MPAPRRQVSPERQTAYYLGGGLMAIGFVLFLSTFVIGIANFGNFNSFDETARTCGFTAIIGMVMIIIGGVIRGIGAQGMAGSGVVLDPEQARRDLEPHARMAGGLVKDALDEADIRLTAPAADEAQLPFDERLRRLHQVRQEGLISEAEYQAAKAKILAEV